QIVLVAEPVVAEHVAVGPELLDDARGLAHPSITPRRPQGRTIVVVVVAVVEPSASASASASAALSGRPRPRPRPRPPSCSNASVGAGTTALLALARPLRTNARQQHLGGLVVGILVGELALEGPPEHRLAEPGDAGEVGIHATQRFSADRQHPL